MKVIGKRVCVFSYVDDFYHYPDITRKNNEQKINTILNELTELVNAESERNEKGTEQYKYKQKNHSITQRNKHIHIEECKIH